MLHFDSTDDGDITTVNSYDTFNYATQIKDVDGIRNSYIIDIRPRVSEFTVLKVLDLLLNFLEDLLMHQGNSAANILASDEDILTTFSYYQGRIDRIFLTKGGRFKLNMDNQADKTRKTCSC